MASDDGALHRVDDGSCAGRYLPAKLVSAAGICVRIHNRFKMVQDIIQQIKADAKAKKDPSETVKTASPIKHVIVLIGENRGLDHTFGVYKPKGSGSDHLEPAVEGHRQRRRHAWSELRTGPAVLRRGAAVVLYRCAADGEVAL